MKILIIILSFSLLSVLTLSKTFAESYDVPKLQKLLNDPSFMAHVEKMENQEFSLRTITDTMAGKAFFYKCDCVNYELTFMKSVEKKGTDNLADYKEIKRIFALEMFDGKLNKIEELK